MEGWITVNGSHVLLKDGQSVEEAMAERKEGTTTTESHQEANENIKGILNAQKAVKQGKMKNINAARFISLFTPKIMDHIYAMGYEVRTKYHKRTNYNTRQWYHEKLQSIPSLLEGIPEKTLDIQSKVAYALREETRTQARDLMKNKEDREMLERERKSLTYEELIDYKKEQHGFETDEEAKKSIIESAAKPSPEFDKLAEKDKDEEDDE